MNGAFRTYTVPKKRKKTALEKAEAKADKEFSDYACEWMQKVNYASILALHRHYGWGKLRISRLIDDLAEIYQECVRDKNLTVLQLCDDIGVEFRNAKGESYKDVSLLSKEEAIKTREWLSRQPAEIIRKHNIAVHKKHMSWVYPQFVASTCLALHRKEGWGLQRMGEISQFIDDIIHEFDDRSLDEFREVTNKETNIGIVWINNQLGIPEHKEKK